MLQWQFKASQTMTIPAKIMIAEQSEQFAKPQLQPIKSNLRRERSQAIAAKVAHLLHPLKYIDLGHYTQHTWNCTQ